MKSLAQRRAHQNISQRALAKASRVSYKSIQLAESELHNATLKTLEHISQGLTYPDHVFLDYVNHYFDYPPDCVTITSIKMHHAKDDDVLIWFFYFVDAFIQSKDLALVTTPPCPALAPPYIALLASTTECLCHQFELCAPSWTTSITTLTNPWFVSGVENLKAMAILESPVWYKKRNIFVLDNFLKRV